MKHRYLDVTFRHGKPIAAYLYLPRKIGARVARTVDEGRGLRVDFDADGTPMGIEITTPSAVGVEDLNAVLGRLGLPTLARDDWSPLKAA